MKTEIAKVVQDFGATVGLGSALDLEKEGTIRLELNESENFGIDFEEDADGKTVWIYCDLFPGVDNTQEANLISLLRLLFQHHRISSAQLTIDPHSFSIMLVNSFTCSNHLYEGKTTLELFDDHLKRFVELAEILRSSLNKK
jgi:hypothetical protein